MRVQQRLALGAGLGTSSPRGSSADLAAPVAAAQGRLAPTRDADEADRVLVRRLPPAALPVSPAAALDTDRRVRWMPGRSITPKRLQSLDCQGVRGLVEGHSQTWGRRSRHADGNCRRRPTGTPRWGALGALGAEATGSQRRRVRDRCGTGWRANRRHHDPSTHPTAHRSGSTRRRRTERSSRCRWESSLCNCGLCRTERP